MDFEKSLKELETIVKNLENNSTTLEEGIELFEKGIALSKECFFALDKNRKKIDSIKSEMDKLLAKGSEDEL